jgi:hypothetical protein
MKWVLVILSLSGAPREEGPYERDECERIARQMNSPSSYLHTSGVEGHCWPKPRED